MRASHYLTRNGPEKKTVPAYRIVIYGLITSALAFYFAFDWNHRLSGAAAAGLFAGTSIGGMGLLLNRVAKHRGDARAFTLLRWLTILCALGNLGLLIERIIHSLARH